MVRVKQKEIRPVFGLFKMQFRSNYMCCNNNNVNIEIMLRVRMHSIKQRSPNTLQRAEIFDRIFVGGQRRKKRTQVV